MRVYKYVMLLKDAKTMQVVLAKQLGVFQMS